MINFFRKIRHNLLSEGKSGKYLKYSIGEIILVVIGILIALQINNWNENRKTDKLSKSFLINIKSDLISDTITYGKGIKRLEKSLKKVESLMNNNFTSSLSPDSIISLMSGSFHSVRIYQINNSTFQKMTNSGFLESKSFSNIFFDVNDYYNKEYNTFSEYLNWDIESDTDVFDQNFMDHWYDKITLPDLRKGEKTEIVSDRMRQSEKAFRLYINSPRFKNYNWSYTDRKKRILERMKYQKRIAEDLIKNINLNIE